NVAEEMIDSSYDQMIEVEDDALELLAAQMQTFNLTRTDDPDYTVITDGVRALLDQWLADNPGVISQELIDRADVLRPSQD
ncbi:hypothetical protein ACFLVL_03915, partial [Chloroflexota bacterium]